MNRPALLKLPSVNFALGGCFGLLGFWTSAPGSGQRWFWVVEAGILFAIAGCLWVRKAEIALSPFAAMLIVGGGLALVVLVSGLLSWRLWALAALYLIFLWMSHPSYWRLRERMLAKKALTPGRA